MKWDVGRDAMGNGKEATMEIENGSQDHKKQIEGCITSDDAEIYNTMLKTHRMHGGERAPTCSPGERERMSQHTTCTRSTLRFFLNPCQADLRSNINDLSIYLATQSLSLGFPR